MTDAEARASAADNPPVPNGTGAPWKFWGTCLWTAAAIAAWAIDVHARAGLGTFHRDRFEGGEAVARHEREAFGEVRDHLIDLFLREPLGGRLVFVAGSILIRHHGRDQDERGTAGPPGSRTLRACP